MTIDKSVNLVLMDKMTAVTGLLVSVRVIVAKMSDQGIGHLLSKSCYIPSILHGNGAISSLILLQISFHAIMSHHFIQ